MCRAAYTTFGAKDLENMAGRMHGIRTQQVYFVKGDMPIHLTLHAPVGQAPTNLLQSKFELARNLNIVLDRMCEDEYIIAEENERDINILNMETKLAVLALVPYRVNALMQSSCAELRPILGSLGHSAADTDRVYLKTTKPQPQNC